LAKFVYKAKKGLNDAFEGVIEAANQEEALSRLLQQGLFPTKVEPEISAADKSSALKKSSRAFKKRVTSSDILVFTQKLATLVRAKVELLSALRILYEQTENLRFKEIIFQMYNSTKEGKTFSEALEKFPKLFPFLYVNIIKAGEASGRLEASLDQVSDFLSREQGLKTKITVALAYPVLLILVGSASIFVLINFVIPRLRPILENLGAELPLITKIILRLSALSSQTWWAFLGIIIFLILVLYHLKGIVFFKRLIRKTKASLPILKRLTKNQELDYFSRSLCLLLKSGVPALKSLEVSTAGIEDPQLKEELKKTYQNIASGQGIAKSMETLTSLPVFFTKMVAVGEESGRLAEVLDEISHSYVQQIETDITLIASLLEPILILALGLVLGTIVLSILLPIFQITQMAH
jgi:type II secretory pathway component PulF